LLAGAVAADEQDASRQAAAARVVNLAVTLLTAFAVHNIGDKNKKLPAAAWQVLMLTALCTVGQGGWAMM